jgi:hypothetical protein
MIKNSNWQWSNFTWSNSSINNQRIGWRIYYNDTSGNQNGTDIQTFDVGSIPKYSNNKSSIATTCSNSQFNITWTDVFGISTVFIEGNWSGSPVNYTSIQYGSVYSYSTLLFPGTFYWKSYANNSFNMWNSSDSWIFTVTQGGYIYSIKGNAYDSSTGIPVSTGTATVIIKENGDRNIGPVTNGAYNVNLGACLNSNQTKFTVGLIFSGGGKQGYNQIILGNGPFATQTQKCSTNQLHFTGTATDADTGAVISNGTVSVNVKEVNTYTNSTTFSNSNWDIYISPCLISGGLYTFNFIVRSSDGKQSNLFINQIAP